jgi:hypothetical protein
MSKNMLDVLTLSWKLIDIYQLNPSAGLSPICQYKTGTVIGICAETRETEKDAASYRLHFWRTSFQKCTISGEEAASVS